MKDKLLHILKRVYQELLNLRAKFDARITANTNEIHRKYWALSPETRARLRLAIICVSILCLGIVIGLVVNVNRPVKIDKSSKSLKIESTGAMELKLPGVNLNPNIYIFQEAITVDVPIELKVPGRLAFNAERSKVLSARAPGRVERIYAFDGAAVEVGSPIIELYSPEFLSAQQEYLLSSKTTKVLESSKTMSDLLGDAQITQQAAANRMRNLGASDGDIKSLEKTGKTQYNLIMRSPLQGLVVKRSVDPGAIVNAGGFDRGAYTELAELGLAGLYVSEAHGGLGMGPVEAMVVMEELGRGIVLEPLAQTLIASAVLQTHAPADLQSGWLPRIAAGEAIVVLAHQERGARHQLDRCQAQAQEAGGQWTVSGTKSIVPVGDQADAFIVPAMAGGQMALFLVERSASGVHSQGYLTQDGARAAEVQFKNSPAQLITQSGLTALTQAADIGSACVCAEAVGVMDKTLAITAEYMNTRKQFGVPIASFQALRHRTVEMYVAYENARGLVLNQVEHVQAHGLSDHPYKMTLIKLYLASLARLVSESAIQLHGGMGMTTETQAARLAVRAITSAFDWGDNAQCLDWLVARNLAEAA